MSAGLCSGTAVTSLLVPRGSDDQPGARPRQVALPFYPTEFKQSLDKNS
jgi:hypothetical protein